MFVDGHLFKDSFLREDVSHCGLQLLTAGMRLQLEDVELVLLNLFQLLYGLRVAFQVICYCLWRQDLGFEDLVVEGNLFIISVI